jgi:hypothetical protein
MAPHPDRGRGGAGGKPQLGYPGRNWVSAIKNTNDESQSASILTGFLGLFRRTTGLQPQGQNLR